MFLRAMARTGCSRSGSSSATPRRGPGGGPVTAGRGDVEGVVDHGGGEAPLGHLRLGALVDHDVAPGRVVDGQLGDVLAPGALPRRVVVVDDRRPAPQDAGDGARRRQVERDRQDVLGDHHVGAVDGGGQLVARRARSVLSKARPRTRWSASPTPAMVVTSKPSSVSARRHDSATTETPSGRPRRNETRAAVGTADQVTVGPATVAGPWSSSRCSTTSTDHVATVTINRPERRNAMSWTVMTELRQAFAAAKADDEVRVVVLTGAGDKAFSAGADLSGMAAGAGFAALHDARGEMARLFREVWELGKPTVARVRGYALAGGFGAALMCDVVIAADDAVFGTPEIDVGLWPMMITVPMLRSMPPKVALELMMTGRRVRADEALRIGFVNRVVPVDELDAAVAEVTSVLAAKSPSVMKLGPRRVLRGDRPRLGPGPAPAAGRAHARHADRGRRRGPGRLRREARPGVEGPLSASAASGRVRRRRSWRRGRRGRRS